MKYWKISGWLFSFGTIEYVEGETAEEAIKKWSLFKEVDFNNKELVIEFKDDNNFRLRRKKEDEIEYDLDNKDSLLKAISEMIALPMINSGRIDEVDISEYVNHTLLKD